jgi:TonB family protein
MVPLLSLNEIPELGKTQPKPRSSKEQLKSKPKITKSKKSEVKSEVKKTTKDKDDSKSILPKTLPDTVVKATKQMEEVLDKPQGSIKQNETKQFTNRKILKSKPMTHSTLSELRLQKQNNRNGPPVKPKSSSKVVAQSGSNLLQNNMKLAAIIFSASQLPAKSPPIAPLPKRIESNLFKLLAGTELVPAGAPTIMTAMRAAPPTKQLSDQEALAYSEQINNVIIALWDVPFHLVDSNLVVMVRFTVQPNGKVMKYRVEDLSGNKALDNSVLTLIRDLRMFPPLPDSYTLPIYEFGVRFSPKYFQF